MVAEPSGIRCELYCPGFSFSKVKHKLVRFLLRLGTVLLLFFLLFLFVFVAFQHFRNGAVFLVLHELRISLAVKEHYINVPFCPPAAVAPVAGLVRRPCHGLSVECPAEIAVTVSAFRKVCDSAVLQIYQSRILIVPATVCLIVAQDISAVRAPFEALVTVGI